MITRLTCEVIPRFIDRTSDVFRHVAQSSSNEQEQPLKDEQVHLEIWHKEKKRVPIAVISRNTNTEE